MKATLKALDKIDPKIITHFRLTGKSDAISPETQAYIRQLDRAVEIRNYQRNISRAAMELREEFPHLGVEVCRQRIYDAINRFHLNSTVKQEAWYNYYADFMEDIARAALAGRKAETAMRAAQVAAEYRIKASAANINPDDFKPNINVISPQVKSGDLGLTTQDLKLIWPDTKNFVGKLPIDDKDKRRVLTEAALALGETVDFEINDQEDEE